MSDERQRELAARLSEFFGVPVEISDEPLVLTPEEFSAARRGEAVTRVEAVEPDPDHPGFEKGVTDAEVAAWKREAADARDRGECGHVEPVERFAQADPEYAAQSAARRMAAEEARNAGLPEPPPVKVPAAAYEARERTVRELRALQREEAEALRIEARDLEGRASLARHHARARATPSSMAARRGSSRERTHAPRRRRQATATKSGGDPPGSTDADDDHHRPPQLLLHDLALHLAHVGPLGVEREWFETQVAAMGHALERVRAAVALGISLGQVRAEVTDDGDHVLYAVFGGRSR